MQKFGPLAFAYSCSATSNHSYTCSSKSVTEQHIAVQLAKLASSIGLFYVYTADDTIYNGCGIEYAKQHSLTSHLMLQAFTNYTSKVDQNLANQVVYRVWLVAKDSLDNEQTALSSVTVKTVRTTPPAFQELLVEYNAPSSVYIEVSIPGIPHGRSTSCQCTPLLQDLSRVLEAAPTCCGWCYRGGSAAGVA